MHFRTNMFLRMMRECTWQAGAADFTNGVAYELLPLLTSRVCHSRPPGPPGYFPPGPAFSVVVPRCLPCLIVLTRSAMMRFPFLVYMSFPPPPSLLLHRLATAMMKFPTPIFNTALLWFRVMVMLRFLSHAPRSCLFSSPPIAHPHLQAGGHGRCSLGYG
jgi:hypothetical protein